MALNAEKPFGTDNQRDLSSLQSEWVTVGTIAAADGSALGVTARTFGSTSANAIELNSIPKSWNSVEVQFENATEDDNGIVDVYVGRVGSDIARRIFTIAWITGTQTGDGSGLELIDTMTITNRQWYGTITDIDGNGDHIAGVQFDLFGYNRIMFHGHTTIDSALTVKVAGA